MVARARIGELRIPRTYDMKEESCLCMTCRHPATVFLNLFQIDMPPASKQPFNFTAFLLRDDYQTRQSTNRPFGSCFITAPMCVPSWNNHDLRWERPGRQMLSLSGANEPPSRAMIGLLSWTVLNLLPGFIRSSPFDFSSSRVVDLIFPTIAVAVAVAVPQADALIPHTLLTRLRGGAFCFETRTPFPPFCSIYSVGVSLRATDAHTKAISATLGFHSRHVFPLRFSMLGPAGRFSCPLISQSFSRNSLLAISSPHPPPLLLI